jgi:hypothetical protein
MDYREYIQSMGPEMARLVHGELESAAPDPTLEIPELEGAERDKLVPLVITDASDPDGRKAVYFEKANASGIALYTLPHKKADYLTPTETYLLHKMAAAVDTLRIANEEIITAVTAKHTPISEDELDEVMNLVNSPKYHGDETKDYPYEAAVDRSIIEVNNVEETVLNAIDLISASFVILGSDQPLDNAINFLAAAPTLYANFCRKQNIQTNLELLARFAGTGAIGESLIDVVLPLLISIDEDGSARFLPNTFKYLDDISRSRVGGCPVVGHTGVPAGQPDPGDTIITQVLQKAVNRYEELKAALNR